MAVDSKAAARTITREELAQIMGLPVREFNFGGTQKRGRYDEENHKFYFMDDEGNLVGKIATVTFREKPPDPEKATGAAAGDDSPGTPGHRSSIGTILRKLAGASNEEIMAAGPSRREKKASARKEKDKPGLTEEDKKRRKLFIGGAILITMVFLALVIVPSVIRGSVSNFAGPRTQPGTSVQPGSVLDSITVIQVTRDLIPGDLIAEEDLRPANLSAADYNMIYSSSAPLYQWSRCEDLLQTQNYATEYIPSGLYLSYENVSGVYPQAINPWIEQNSGGHYATVPIPTEMLSDPRLTFGAVFDMTVQKSTQRSSTAPGEDGDIDGMKIITIREDRTGYSLQGLVVCDLLNVNEESLFSRFAHLMEIPSGEQVTYLRNLFLTDQSAEEALSPHFIRFSLTDAQAKELGDLRANNIAIEISFSEQMDSGTDVKLKAAKGTQVLQENIRLAMQRNSEAQAEREGTSDGEQ